MESYTTNLLRLAFFIQRNALETHQHFLPFHTWAALYGVNTITDQSVWPFSPQETFGLLPVFGHYSYN